MSGHRLTGCRVFVVEDEWFIAFDFKEHLEQVGAIIQGPASSVREALEILQTLDRLPEVASLDLMLPDGPSIRIADELELLGVPFIFATGTPEMIPDRYNTRTVCSKPVGERAWINALVEAMNT